jgi:hypothetical protein
MEDKPRLTIDILCLFAPKARHHGLYNEELIVMNKAGETLSIGSFS